jgi:hypothetical protein
MTNKSKGPKLTPFVMIVLALGVLALVAYQVHSGVAMKNVGLLGMKINFADKPAAQPRPEASREFVVGHWQVEQANGQLSGATSIDYLNDGNFSGTMMAFVGGNGVKQPTSGQWKFEKLSADTFRLRVTFDNHSTWQGTFRIFDQDHIQNIDENYVAVRVK